MARIAATHAAWTAVDQTDDPDFFIRFLDASRAGVVAAAVADPGATFSYLDVHPGQRVLDAACGLGELTGVLARLVVPDGEVVGVDFSSTMVDEARRRARGSGMPVRFERGNIMGLDFPDNSFDRSRAEQVLQHIPSPETAVGELVRVTRPGGLVAVLEPDWDTLIIDADDLDVSRAFTVFNSTVVVPHGAVGRSLPALFKDAGLTDVDVSPSVVMAPYSALRDFIESNTKHAVESNVMDAARAGTWLRELEQRAGAGRFFAGFCHFRVVGRVPQH